MATKPMVFLKNIDFSYLWLVWPASTHCDQVKTLKEHQLLVEKAKAKNVLLQIEVENLDIWMMWTSTTDNFKYCFGIFSILHINNWFIINSTTMTLMFVIAMIIIFWLFHVFSRCTRGSIQSTVTRGWEFRNLVRFCAFISSEKSQDHYHSHRHHNCFRHYSFDSTSNWSCQRLSQPMNATF